MMRSTAVTIVRRSAVLACLVLGLTGVAGAQESSEPVSGVPLDGVVDPFIADHIDNEIARAEDAGSPAVLITIDTPGGLDSAMRQITQAIGASTVPVICYVGPSGARAASAGAFVLMSCPIAAMAPGTNVGAATPVGLSGAVSSSKAVNDAAAYMRSLAEAHGRDADLAESFVRDATSITAEQALADGMIDLIAATPEELLDAVDGTTVELVSGPATLATAGVPIEEHPMGGLIGTLRGLLTPDLAFVFFWLGLILIIIEIFVPGHIFSGTVGTIMLILAIVSFGVLPVRLVGIVLLVIAAIALLVEINMPGIGVWGAVGLLALVLGGWFLIDRSGGAGVSPWVIAPTAIAVGLFFGLVVTKVMSIGKMPPAQGPQAVIGAEGVAIGGGLNPEGLVRVAAEEWRAVSSAGRVPQGAKVRVTGLEGLTLTVEPVTELEHAPADTPDDGEGDAT